MTRGQRMLEIFADQVCSSMDDMHVPDDDVAYWRRQFWQVLDALDENQEISLKPLSTTFTRLLTDAQDLVAAAREVLSGSAT